MLGLQEAQAGNVHRPGYSPAPPVGPVPSQGRVVRRRGSPDHLVPDDLRPGEPAEVSAAVAFAERQKSALIRRRVGRPFPESA
jgi:hypothetical protein